VLFLFFTGEERGLLGSTYYATNPIVPLADMRALINLDAGAPPAPPLNWRIAGDSAILGPLARDVAERHGWSVQFSAATPNSDYWPFARRGVPAAFLVPGDEWEGTSRARQAELRRRWDHYHAASDHWAEDFPFAGLARYATFALELGRAAARRP
jgi:Zn-dependent M28 family amino/carboxypeptidase